MSLYKNEITIGGIRCGLILREGDDYEALFEREFASLEDIEGIQWDPPEIVGDCILPHGCGFDVTGISYSHSERCYRVKLALGKQYLGDVTGYQEQVGRLQEQLQKERSQTREALDELQKQLDSVERNAVAEAELRNAYAEGVNGNE